MCPCRKKKKSSSKVAVSGTEGKEPSGKEEMEEAGSSLDIPDTRTAYEKKWDEQVRCFNCCQLRVYWYCRACAHSPAHAVVSMLTMSRAVVGAPVASADQEVGAEASQRVGKNDA